MPHSTKKQKKTKFGLINNSYVLIAILPDFLQIHWQFSKLINNLPFKPNEKTIKKIKKPMYQIK